MVCRNRRRRRQATVQLAPLIAGTAVSTVIVGTTVGAITVATIATTLTVGATTVGTIAVATAVGPTAVGASPPPVGGAEKEGSEGVGGIQGQQRRERVGQVGFECSNASGGRTGHRCRRSLRISTVPCRSWPRGPFARTVHSGAPSRWARAAIPLGATLRRWYRRQMVPRDQNSPSAVLTANGGAAVAAGGWHDGCLHRDTRTAVFRVHFHSIYHRLFSVLHTLHGWSGTLH